ncbi:MAG TPA: amidase [Alphaproteobacteria bacterium]|nr:amidase [Alphaproteobacteria bacterium]
MSEREPWRLSATELLAGYAARAFKPSEVLAAVQTRIAEVEPALSAFLASDPARAEVDAKAADAAWDKPGEKPALCGVPISIKDTIEVEGMPTTYGSLAFKDNRQPDAELVTRLRAAGAVILGKTNTPEFALGAHTVNRLGPSTKNPWDQSRTSGGSSGGAAAAVASGMGPLAIGTDSGGSIRLPSAYQGIYGLKPSYQRIPSVQTWRASPGRSHNGPITRTVADAALLMQVLAKPDPRDVDSTTLPPADFSAYAKAAVRGARIAIAPYSKDDCGLEDLQRGLLADAAKLLESLGCKVSEAAMPLRPGSDEMAPGVWAYSGDHFGAAESMIPGFWDKHAADLTDYTRPIYEAGQRALAWQYRQILRRNQAYKLAVQRWFADYDFFVGPCCGAAPLGNGTNTPEERAKNLRYLMPLNFSHNPAAAVPFAQSTEGLPLAIQLVGRLGDDAGVLSLSAALEAVRPWSGRWPSL